MAADEDSCLEIWSLKLLEPSGSVQECV